MVALMNKKNLVSQVNIRKFINLYTKEDNWHNLDKGGGDLGYGWIHYSLIRNMRPKKVLVIGSKYGFIPAICALACRDNDQGVVDFVDANYDVELSTDRKRHWGGVGFWKKVDPAKHFGKFELENYITIHLMSTDKFYQKNSTKKWQYLYLDGDHSYKGVKHDFGMFWPRLTKGGYILLHDIYSDSSIMKELGDFNFGVGKLWKELKQKYSSTVEFGGRYGLGLLQKL